LGADDGDAVVTARR